MNIDQHLGTGDYNPEKYWSARAKNSQEDDIYKAVCVFGATKAENWSADRVQRYFLKKALNQIDLTGHRALEYGCGAGRWIKLFHQKGYEWAGVDISDEMLKIARNRWQNAKLAKVQDGYRIPFPDQSFDLVYSVTVVHHNDYEQQEKIISEMVRVLKDGGKLILLEDLGEKSSFNMFARNKKSWLELLDKYSMKNVRYQELSYWIIRDWFHSKLSKRPLLWNLWRKSIGFIDLLFDPYLIFLFPRKIHVIAAIMVFNKSKAV